MTHHLSPGEAVGPETGHPKYRTMAHGLLWIKVTWQAARGHLDPPYQHECRKYISPVKGALPTPGRLREALITRVKRSRAKMLLQYKHLTDLLPKPKPRLDSPRMNTPTLLRYLSNEHFGFLVNSLQLLSRLKNTKRCLVQSFKPHFMIWASYCDFLMHTYCFFLLLI